MEGWVEDFDTLDARQFTIAVRKLADSLSYGIDKSPFVGSGIEYAQSRPYEMGDPVRSMDWRVTARTRKFHVKEYETPKSLPCYLLIDTSASMAVASTKPTKYELALYVAGGIALACLDRVSPVGVIGVGERKIRIQPSLARPRVLQWLLELRKYRYDEGTRLGVRIGELAPSLAQRSLIVVISDLHDADALPALKRLSGLHDCVVLQMADPAEEGLRGAGLFRAREAETGREILAKGRQRWVDPAIVERELERAGIDHLRIVTNRPFAHSLRHLFRNRASVGRGAR